MSLRDICSYAALVALIVGLMNALPGCSDDARQDPGIRGAAIIEIAMPEKLGPMQRPAVEFKHDKHVKALEKQGCQECHPVDENKKMRPHLKKSLPLSIIEGLSAYWEEFGKDIEVPAFSEIYADFYHDACMGCHEQMRKKGQKTGPEECGECHLKLPPI
jgi:hypothetical protein